MSEDAATVYERGLEADYSAEEAWECIQDRNDETEWDIEGMLGRHLSQRSDDELEETP